MNLASFFNSLKGKVYYKYKNNKYYLFGVEAELTYLYFNLYTDRNGIRFIKIGITKHPLRRKRENDKLFTKDSVVLCRTKIPFAKEIEHHIHNVYLDKKHRAVRFFDIDIKGGGKKYINFDNQETYKYDEVKDKIDLVVNEIKKIEYIDDIKNLSADVLMKHLMPENKLDKYVDPEFKEEETYDYDELIKGNLNQYGKYRVSSMSFQMINDLRSKKIDNDREYGFIKDMCSLVSRNKSLTKNQIHWLNILSEKYLVVN